MQNCPCTHTLWEVETASACSDVLFAYIHTVKHIPMGEAALNGVGLYPQHIGTCLAHADKCSVEQAQLTWARRDYYCYIVMTCIVWFKCYSGTCIRTPIALHVWEWLGYDRYPPLSKIWLLCHTIVKNEGKSTHTCKSNGYGYMYERCAMTCRRQTITTNTLATINIVMPLVK